MIAEEVKIKWSILAYPMPCSNIYCTGIAYNAAAVLIKDMLVHIYSCVDCLTMFETKLIKIYEEEGL